MSMKDADKLETPELDKQREIIHSGKSDTVQDFYDWLQQQGYKICVRVDGDYHPTFSPPEDLMAEFFGINLGKIEKERRALLEAIRK